MATKFDFNNIGGLNTFWDGSTKANNWGGGQFNTHTGQAGINANLDNLYQSLIGRNADSGGRDYWAKQIASGATDYQGVANAIKATNEYTDQQTEITNNPNATASDLKSLGSAYVSPFHWGSGSAAAGWQPGDAITSELASAVSSDPSTGGSYGDQTNKNVLDVVNSLGITGGVGGGGGSMNYQPYDDSGLLAQIAGLKSAFDAYKKQSADDMKNMWNNANWGWGQTVGGVRTQNELPGWAPKKGGTSGFFGRGGRSGKGLTTSSLNL